MAAGERDRLERNVIAGLPGGAAAQTRASIAELIEGYRGIDVATMRANLAAFLAEVVPVAEEAGVRLGIHPDDPPFPLFGLPRIVSTAADARAVLAAVDSPANGLTFCTGSYGARPDNDLPAMAREFAPRTNFAHLRNVTLEADRTFHEADHLGGSTDMVAVIAALRGEERRSGRTIPMRPDHGHLLATDVGRPSNPGYSYIGRLKGLAELRGVIAALDHAAGAGVRRCQLKLEQKNPDNVSLPAATPPRLSAIRSRTSGIHAREWLASRSSTTTSHRRGLLHRLDHFARHPDTVASITSAPGQGSPSALVLLIV